MKPLSQERLAWLKLKLIPKMGSVVYGRLLARFSSPEQVFEAAPPDLCQIKGVSPAMADNIAKQNFVSPLDKNLKAFDKFNARMVTIEDDEYPDLLRHIYAPPPVLFVRGSLWPCHGPAIAVIGSRNPTPYGKKVASELAADLASARAAVVSGLARGIDSIAHQGALERNGYTVGVLACSLDYVYPPENRDLIQVMAEKGAVISESLIDISPQPWLFPIRNRIISGLCQATVVVEANLKSGSLITARHALDQGREVFAVPGPISSRASQGCHALLKQGAGLLGNIQDLYDAGLLPVGQAILSAWPSPPLAAQMQQSEEYVGLTLPAESKIILDLLSVVPLHIDDIIRQSGLPAQEVTALLVDLELEGLVDQTAGRNYIKL